MAKKNYSFALFLVIFLEGPCHYFVEVSTTGPPVDLEDQENTVILKYEFYPRIQSKGPDPCLAKTYWNNSTTFSFSDQSPLPNLMVKNESIHIDELRINCISSQPKNLNASYWFVLFDILVHSDRGWFLSVASMMMMSLVAVSPPPGFLVSQRCLR